MKKNVIKNSILLFLFVLMFPLTAFAWFSYLDTSSIPEDSMFANIYKRVTYGVNGFEIKTNNNPAAMPTRIAIRHKGEMNGAQYNEPIVAVFYDAVCDILGKALEQKDEFENADIFEFQESLKLDGIYMGYEGSLPISLISSWIGYESKNLIETDIIWLDSTGTVYIHTVSGFRKKKTNITADKWELDLLKLPENRCEFAANDENFKNIRQDTIIFEKDVTQLEQYNVLIPDFLNSHNGANLSNLLSAFSYEINVNRYEENQGNTTVFVGDYSTLHVSSDGTVVFNASANEGSLEVSSDPEYANMLSVQSDTAYSLVRDVQNSMGDTSQAMLYNVSFDEMQKTRVFTFIQCIGGVPVQMERPFAQIVIQDNKLTDATFYLNLFGKTDIQTPIISSRYAAAASNNEFFRLMMIYAKNEQGLLTAQNVYGF